MNDIAHSGVGGEAPARMTTREVAELTGKAHRNVMRDCDVMFAALDIDPEGYAQIWAHPQNGQSYREYALPKDLTMTLVSGYDVKMRHAIVTRLQQMEQRPTTAIDVRSLPQLQTIALQLIEVNKEQSEQIAAMAPKVQAFELLEASEGSVTFTQAAKLLGVKRDTLTRWMHTNGWVYRQNASWVAYSQHIQNGRLEYKEANYTDQKTGMKVSKPYCHITPKGLTKLATIFGSDVKNAA